MEEWNHLCWWIGWEEKTQYESEKIKIWMIEQRKEKEKTVKKTYYTLREVKEQK